MIVVPSQESGGEGSIRFAMARCSRTVNLIYIVILSISSFPRRRESSGLCPTHTHRHTCATVNQTRENPCNPTEVGRSRGISPLRESCE